MINIKKSTLVLSVATFCTTSYLAVQQLPAIASYLPEIAIAQGSEESAEEESSNPMLNDPSSEDQSTNTPTDALELNAQPASREQIEALLTITGADTTHLILEQMIGQFRVLTPEVPDEWWEGFMEKAIATDFNALLFPIYERNYTAAEIDGLIEFYQSPLGQSLLEKAPVIAQESLAVGQAWGLEIAQELIAELEADGFDLPAEVSSPEPAGPSETNAEETNTEETNTEE